MPATEPKTTCGAKNRQGKPCSSKFLCANGRCRMHGGTNPGRPIVHGRYSKVHGRIREAIAASEADTTLLDMRKTVAVFDALTKFALERAESKDTPEFRRRALKLLLDAREATVAEDAATARDRIIELEGLLREGIAEDRSMRELSSSAFRLYRVQGGAWQVKLARKNAMSLRDAIAFMGRFVEIARRELPPELAARLERCVTVEMAGSVTRPQLGPKAESGGGE